jgi:hypothetical protein
MTAGQLRITNQRGESSDATNPYGKEDGKHIIFESGII